MTDGINELSFIHTNQPTNSFSSETNLKFKKKKTKKLQQQTRTQNNFNNKSTKGKQKIFVPTWMITSSRS